MRNGLLRQGIALLRSTQHPKINSVLSQWPEKGYVFSVAGIRGAIEPVKDILVSPYPVVLCSQLFIA